MPRGQLVLALRDQELSLLRTHPLLDLVVLLHGDHPRAQRRQRLRQRPDLLRQEVLVLKVGLDGAGALPEDGRVEVVTVLVGEQRVEELVRVAHHLLRRHPVLRTLLLGERVRQVGFQHRLHAEAHADGGEHLPHLVRRVRHRPDLHQLPLVDLLQLLDRRVQRRHRARQHALARLLDLPRVLRLLVCGGLLDLHALARHVRVRFVPLDHGDELRSLLRHRDKLRLLHLQQRLHRHNRLLRPPQLLDTVGVPPPQRLHTLRPLRQQPLERRQQLQVRRRRDVHLLTGRHQVLHGSVPCRHVHVDHGVHQPLLLARLYGHVARRHKVPPDEGKSLSGPLAEVVDRAAVDECGEDAYAVAKRGADRREAHDHVQLRPCALHEHVVARLPRLHVAASLLLCEAGHALHQARQLVLLVQRRHLPHVEDARDVLQKRLVLHALVAQQERGGAAVLRTGGPLHHQPQVVPPRLLRVRLLRLDAEQPVLRNVRGEAGRALTPAPAQTHQQRVPHRHLDDPRHTRHVLKHVVEHDKPQRRRTPASAAPRHARVVLRLHLREPLLHRLQLGPHVPVHRLRPRLGRHVVEDQRCSVPVERGGQGAPQVCVHRRVEDLLEAGSVVLQQPVLEHAQLFVHPQPHDAVEVRHRPAVALRHPLHHLVQVPHVVHVVRRLRRRQQRLAHPLVYADRRGDQRPLQLRRARR
eukprot:Rhum_TRINITY_DN15411_c13_g1::Rhum_TRINITY_DN15411_c13_g1_i1::g.156183::m.156183